MTLAQIRQQPWYSSVAASMNAAGVPEAIWTATLNDESGGDPSQHNLNYKTGDDSYGLFQLNRNGGIGAPYSPSTLLNPVSNAEIAAPIMGSAISKSGAKSPGLQLRAVEYAGWNGSLSEDPERQAWLTQMLKQGASTGNATGVKQTTSGNGGFVDPNDSTNTTITAGPATPQSDAQAVGGAVAKDASNAFGLGGLFTGAAFYAVVGIVILGGFLLISASIIGGGDAAQGALTVGKAAAAA